MQIERVDIDTLLDALDDYEDNAGDVLGTLMGGAMLQKAGESAAAFLADERKKRETEKVRRRERAIMLKAKLLIWRDQLEAKAFSDDALAR
jgi:hypothetical protein